MLSFMHAQYSLFQQGYNLLDDIDPYMKKLAAEVSKASVITTKCVLRPLCHIRRWAVLIGTGLILIYQQEAVT